MDLSLTKHLDKDNLHHAYLVEGLHENVVPKILAGLENLGIKTEGNPDFIQIEVDSFKIEDARNLKSLRVEKSFSSDKGAKKVFLISANSFLLEAQNTMLKMFEEPIEDTHFFLVVPDASALLKTFVSRFYSISLEQELGGGHKEAERFIEMSVKDRMNFIKEFLVEPEENKDEEVIVQNSTRAKAQSFLNALETVLYKKIPRGTLGKYGYFEQIFTAREFLRQPGSSTKSLLESVALITPNFKN